MAKDRLTAKQIEFCKHIANGKGNAEAYRLAFKSTAPDTCKVNASRLLKKPLIAAKIKEFQNQNKKIVDRSIEKAAELMAGNEIADRVERMTILTKIARGQIPLKKPMVCDGVIEEIDVVPDWMDRKNAIAELNRMDGEYAPAKADITSDGKPIESAPTAAVIKFDGKDIEILG